MTFSDLYIRMLRLRSVPAEELRRAQRVMEQCAKDDGASVDDYSAQFDERGFLVRVEPIKTKATGYVGSGNWQEYEI